jgi:hypothetical protein
MTTYMRFCVHLEFNLPNVYWRETCFEEKL